MKQSILAVAALLSCLSSGLAMAECEKPQSPQEILNCALKEHPLVQQARAQATQGGFLVDVAQQRPNPELDANTAIGRSQGDSVLNSQINLSHVFELGGKRSARIEKAKAEIEVITADVLKAKEVVALNTVSALFRLRQLQVEIATLDEALYTFSQIKGQLKSRPRLTPEQEVALATFQLIEGDYRLRKVALSGEEASLIRQIELSIGSPIEMTKSLMPEVKTDWPELTASAESSVFVGSHLNRLRAEVKVAESDLSLAQSAAWPNLKIGPMFQAQTQAGISYQAYGLGLSLPLPLYQTNPGGRAFAGSGLARAEVSLKTATNQLVTERNQEVIKYQAARRALQEAGALREVEKKHQNIERLFKRGLIQSNMVIEAHRQIVELTRDVNEQELIAIRSLWRIYAIEGRVLKETI